MFGQYQYYGVMKKLITSLGSMFSGIMLERWDSNGNVIQQVKVPCAYGPREKYLARLEQNPDLQRQIDQILPRIAFQLDGMQYDPTRKQNTLGKKHVSVTGSTNLSNVLYNPVPYNLTFTVSVLGKSAEDVTQILEQVLPYFTPDWTISIDFIPAMNEHKDIPFILQSVTWQDTYEGNFEEKRAIVANLQILCKAYFYGPMKKSSIILYANTDFFTTDSVTAAVTANSQPVVSNTTGYVSSTRVTPGLTSNGLPTSNASLSIPANTIPSNSNYGIVVSNTASIGL